MGRTMPEILSIGTAKLSGGATQKPTGAADSDGRFAALMADDKVVYPNVYVLAAVMDKAEDVTAEAPLPSEKRQPVKEQEISDGIVDVDQITDVDSAVIPGPSKSDLSRQQVRQQQADLEKGSSERGQLIDPVPAALHGLSPPDEEYLIAFPQLAVPPDGDRAGFEPGGAQDVGTKMPVWREAPQSLGSGLLLSTEKLDADDAAAELAGKRVEAGGIAPPPFDNSFGPAEPPAHRISQPGPSRSEVLRQITEAFVAIRENQVEIALSPEELGKLQLTVRRDEMGAHVVIWAERPETLGLIRRNADLLMREFQEQGISNAEFSFGSGGSGADLPGQQGSRHLPEEPATPVRGSGSDLTIEAPRYRILRSGLDIRV